MFNNSNSISHLTRISLRRTRMPVRNMQRVLRRFIFLTIPDRFMTHGLLEECLRQRSRPTDLHLPQTTTLMVPQDTRFLRLRLPKL